MATIQPTRTIKAGGKALLYTWVLANGDDGAPVNAIEFADRSLQVSGNFGAGGNVRIEGSNDGSAFYPLTDPQGNDLNIVSGKIEAITELVDSIRPRVTAGDGTTSVTVNILMKG